MIINKMQWVWIRPQGNSFAGFGAAGDGNAEAAKAQLRDTFDKAETSLMSQYAENQDTAVALATLFIPIIGPALSLVWEAASKYLNSQKSTLSSNDALDLLEMTMRPNIEKWETTLYDDAVRGTHADGTPYTWAQWFAEGSQMQRGIEAIHDIGADYSIFQEATKTVKQTGEAIKAAAGKTAAAATSSLDSLLKMMPWILGVIVGVNLLPYILPRRS